jgi:hypothetical protein
MVLIYPLLLFAIWRGQGWARLLLGIGCAAISLMSISNLRLLPLVSSRVALPLAIFIVFMSISYLIVSILTFFSPALSGLMAYRQEERDMQ